MEKYLTSNWLKRARVRRGELIFASGPPGISVNLVGRFSVRKYKGGKEDRLDLDDGTNHVHIGWNKISSCKLGDFHGEGMLIFLDNDEIIFKIYKPSGRFSNTIASFEGTFI